MSIESWGLEKQFASNFLYDSCNHILQKYLTHAQKDMPRTEFKEFVGHCVTALQTANILDRAQGLSQQLLLELEDEPASIGYGDTWLGLYMKHYQQSNADARLAKLFRLMIAKINFVIGRLAESSQWVEEILNDHADPEFDEIYAQAILMKVQLLLRQSKNEEASHLLFMHEDMLESSSRTHISYGDLKARVLRRSGQPNEALKYVLGLSKQLQKKGISPIPIEINYEKALLLWVNGRYSEAIQTYQAMLSEHQRALTPSQYAGLLCDLGLVYWSKGDFDQAESNIGESLQLAQSYGNYTEIAALGNLGLVYLSRGQVVDALDYFEKQLDKAKAAQAENEIQRARGNKGIALFHMGQYQDAIDLFEVELTLGKDKSMNEGNYCTLVNLARCLHAIGYSQKAQNYCQAALQWSKEHKHVGMEIISLRALAECSKNDKAKVYLHQALEKATDNRKLDEAACYISLAAIESHQSQQLFERGAQILKKIKAHYWLEHLTSRESQALRILTIV